MFAFPLSGGHTVRAGPLQPRVTSRSRQWHLYHALLPDAWRPSWAGEVTAAAAMVLEPLLKSPS